MHLWAAIIGSLPALALCLSGLILVFEPELQEFEERSYTSVEPSGETIPIDQLIADVENASGRHVTYLRFPRDEAKAALLRTEDKQFHLVDPYDATILKSTKAPAIVMQAIRIFHTSFFAGDFGTWIGIVSSITLIALCVTGGYLFLKRKLTARNLLRVRWQPAARRNYDLHAVTGFLAAIPISAIALSGALIGLGKPWRDAILFITDSEWQAQPKLEEAIGRSDWNFNYESILEATGNSLPQGMFIDSIIFPRKDDEPLRLRLHYDWATRPASWAFIDPANGTLIELHHHWDYEAGHLIHRLNRGFHSGELYTDAMRWLWFVLMLAPFVLAYTGYRQWKVKRKQ